MAGATTTADWPKPTGNTPSICGQAIQYYELSAGLGIKNGQDDLLASVFLNAAQSYQVIGDHMAACAAFDQSGAANQRYIAVHPDVEIPHPAGSRSLGDFIDSRKSEAGCQ